MEKTTRGKLHCITYMKGEESEKKRIGSMKPRVYDDPDRDVLVNIDHGQESPHAFPDASHLTSATYILSH